MEQEKETNTVVLTTQELLKLINHDNAFKSSNWKEWQEDEKSKRRHSFAVLILALVATLSISVLFIYGATINLISKETLTALLGTVAGLGLSIFIKHIEKDGK